MKNLIGILFICVVSTSYSHDLRIAIIDIKERNGQMIGEFRADRVELIKALGCNLSIESIETYIKRNLKIYSNHIPVTIEAMNYELKADVIEVTCSLVGFDASSSEIRVYNQILLDTISDHENVVIFRLHDKIRSFRMSEGRKEILVNYKNI